MTQEEMNELLDKVKDYLRYYLDHHVQYVQYYPSSEETWSYNNSYVSFEVDCYNDIGLGAKWTEVWCIDSDGKITVATIAHTNYPTKVHLILKYTYHIAHVKYLKKLMRKIGTNLLLLATTGTANWKSDTTLFRNGVLKRKNKNKKCYAQ